MLDRADGSTAAATLHRFGDEFKLIEPVVTPSDSHAFMALSLGSGAALHALLSRSWKSMRRDGRVAAIAARYPSVRLA